MLDGRRRDGGDGGIFSVPPHSVVGVPLMSTPLAQFIAQQSMDPKHQ